MRQSDDSRFTGWFFLPNATEERIPGVLIWTPATGADLELFGGFSPKPKYRPSPDGAGVVTDSIVGDVRPGTILGVTTEGKKLSIWDAHREKVSAKFDGAVQQESWTSSWVAVGEHIESPDSLVFSEVALALDDLYYLTSDSRIYQIQWAKFEGIEDPGKKLENGTLVTPYILPIVGGFRAEVEHGKTEKAQFSVGTFASRPFISPATEAMPELKLESLLRRKRRGLEIDVRINALMTVKPNDGVEVSASGLVDLMGPALDLMRLAFYRSSGVEEISFRRKNGENVYLLSRIGDKSNPDDPHDLRSVVFTFDDVSLESYLEIWQRLTPNYQAEYAWNVMIGLCGYTPNYVEEFVSQALAAAEGIELWCFQGSGGASLEERLKNLHSRLPMRIQERLNLDTETWAKAAVWARHHVAHGGTKRKRLISDSSELHAVAQSVHLVTYLCILEELSVSVDKVVDALLNHPRLAAMTRQYETVNGIGEDSAL